MTEKTAVNGQGRQPTCEKRVQAHLSSTLETVKELWTAYNHTDEGYTEDGEHLFEYGLSFDYVRPGTFTDQDEGYARWQLSWGGPSDEFRAYINPDMSVHRIEYWFLDWFDGAHRTLHGEDYETVLNVIDLFLELQDPDTFLTE